MKDYFKKSNEESNLEEFYYHKYGEVLCSKCNKPLFNCYCISTKEDEEGWEWRMFHVEEYEELRKKYTIEELYKMFPIAPMLPSE